MRRPYYAKQIDDKRRIILPPDFRPSQEVICEQLDAYTWIIKRPRPASNVKMVAIPILHRLPDDPGWDPIESGLARAAYHRLPPPPED